MPSLVIDNGDIGLCGCGASYRPLRCVERAIVTVAAAVLGPSAMGCATVIAAVLKPAAAAANSLPTVAGNTRPSSDESRAADRIQPRSSSSFSADAVSSPIFIYRQPLPTTNSVKGSSIFFNSVGFTRGIFNHRTRQSSTPIPVESSSPTKTSQGRRHPSGIFRSVHSVAVAAISSALSPSPYNTPSPPSPSRYSATIDSRSGRTN
ncbi:unnamed protein product [Cuscuta campestris]|uniref:Uncharacterized protein n=1 Tax=Cuscuta campestris TaxID=132261 RepID=A0A484LDU9_9ASTE|nr:unnamed protein product [Cuscuta campestris]